MFYVVFLKKFDFHPDPEMDLDTDLRLPEKSDLDPEFFFGSNTLLFRQHGEGVAVTITTKSSLGSDNG